MNAVSQWPPTTLDTPAVVEAYTRVLGWPLIAGSTFVSPHRAAADLVARPDTELSTPCSAFDAIRVSHAVGMEAMVLLGRRDVGPVPCLIENHNHVILLVKAGTGGPLSELEGVSVEAGSGGRLVLPPSTGRRWDTPPWNIQSETPCQLPAGPALAPTISNALRLFGSAPPSISADGQPLSPCHDTPAQGAASTPTTQPAAPGSS
ncbi:hypothetical protein [Streptomyces sp. TE33382]